MNPLMVVVHNHASSNEGAPWILDLLLSAGADVNATKNVSVRSYFQSLSKI
jgi:hypothetical protein